MSDETFDEWLKGYRNFFYEEPNMRNLWADRKVKMNRQQKKIDELELQIMERVSEHRETKTELLKVKAKLEKVVEALRFYADKQSWISSSDLKIDDHYSCYVGNDGIEDIWTFVGGNRARKTLEELEEKGE